MERTAELAAIEEFLMQRGATRGRAAFVAPTTTGFSLRQEADRIAAMQVKRPELSRVMLKRIMWRSRLRAAR